MKLIPLPEIMACVHHTECHYSHLGTHMMLVLGSQLRKGHTYQWEMAEFGLN